MKSKHIVITGGSSGLGFALVQALRKYIGKYQGVDCESCQSFVYDYSSPKDVRNPDLHWIDAIPKIDILINCAGVNRIEWIKDTPDSLWDEVMDTNAKGIFKMSKACLPKLIESKGTIVNIVSNASHMPMTCSLAYNASKGAAEIMTRQMARELTKKYGITVFGVSPNRMKGTQMSGDIDEQVCKTRGWSQEEANKNQDAAMLAGQQTDPDDIARHLAFILSTPHKYLTGCVLEFGL